MHMPRLKRIEARAFQQFEDNWLHNSVDKMNRAAQARQDYAVRMATRAGYEAAGTKTGSLVAYLESIGAEDVGPEEAVDMAIRVITGYRTRNDLLEQARIESDDALAAMEDELETAKRQEKRSRDQATRYKSELAILKDQNVTARTGALSVTRGTGSGSHTDSLRTVRVAGVGQAAD